MEGTNGPDGPNFCETVSHLPTRSYLFYCVGFRLAGASLCALHFFSFFLCFCCLYTYTNKTRRRRLKALCALRLPSLCSSAVEAQSARLAWGIWRGFGPRMLQPGAPAGRARCLNQRNGNAPAPRPAAVAQSAVMPHEHAVYPRMGNNRYRAPEVAAAKDAVEVRRAAHPWAGGTSLLS